jgi:hypothetical protein
MKSAFQNMSIVTGWVLASQGPTGQRLQHANGFRAQEIIKGARESLGFIVFDETGRRLGLVKSLDELP